MTGNHLVLLRQRVLVGTLKFYQLTAELCQDLRLFNIVDQIVKFRWVGDSIEELPPIDLRIMNQLPAVGANHSPHAAKVTKDAAVF